MEERILIVDDDHHVLSSLRRQLVGRFNLTTAQGGRQAIAEIQTAQDNRSPFAVVISDMQMPEMNGVETLKRIQAIAPETVRLMLTGNADQQTAIDAINEGNILRFYNKPCAIDVLSSGIKAAIDQYRLVVAERDLLEQTLAGSVKILIDVIAMNDPVISRLATRLRDYVRRLTLEFKFQKSWQLELASSLAPLGQVAIPSEIVTKQRSGQTLTETEQSIVNRAPETASTLIANIPRLGKVAEIVYLQDRGFDGSGFPATGPKGKDIPQEARILKILKDLAVAAGESGSPNAAAFAKLDDRKAQYDPELLSKLRVCLEATAPRTRPSAVEIPVSALKAGQTVLTDIRLTNGLLILPANTQLTMPQIERLRNLQKIFTFVEPIKLNVP